MALYGAVRAVRITARLKATKERSLSCLQKLLLAFWRRWSSSKERRHFRLWCEFCTVGSSSNFTSWVFSTIGFWAPTKASWWMALYGVVRAVGITARLKATKERSLGCLQKLLLAFWRSWNSGKEWRHFREWHVLFTIGFTTDVRTRVFGTIGVGTPTETRGRVTLYQMVWAIWITSGREPANQHFLVCLHSFKLALGWSVFNTEFVR